MELGDYEYFLSKGITHPTRPLPAPSSTLAHVKKTLLAYKALLIHYTGLGVKRSPERTNIVFPTNSSVLFRIRYSASTMPAGQIWPPHSETSVWSFKGGLSRPLKSRDMIWDFWRGWEATRSSETVRWEGGGGDDIVGLLF